MKKLLAGLVFTVGLATSAQSSVMLVDPTDVRNLSNVLFDDGATGSSLLADLNRGPADSVSFSSSQTLMSASSGQARITAMGGLTNLTFMPTTMNTGFTAAEFNINTFNRASGQVTLKAFDQFGLALTSTLDVGNGENRFALQAFDNQVITSVMLTGAAGLIQDVRQVRLGLTSFTPGNGTGTIVPGPIAGAGLPALLALGGLVWARRRKAASAA